MKPTKQEQAKALWLKGEGPKAIAEKLGVTRQCIHNWKRRYKWDELKESLPEETPAPRKLNLVSFDGRDRQTKRSQVDLTKIDYDTLEGRIQAIDELLDAARREVINPTSPQQYSAALNGFNKLLESRDRAKPIDRVALLMILMDKYRDPGDLLEDLKTQGWGRKAS